MAYYKIDLNKLTEIKSKIKLEKDKFKDGYTVFSNYMLSDSNQTSRAITEGVNQAANKAMECYRLLYEWLEDYIYAVREAEQKASSSIGKIDSYQYIKSQFSNVVSNSTITPIGGAVGLSLGSATAGGSNESSTISNQGQVTKSLYDEEFEKIKVKQDTKPLEEAIAKKEAEIKTINSASEKEKAEKELQSLKYELGTLKIINDLQVTLRKFESFDEYKAYVQKLQKELNTDNYLAIELIHLLINKKYDTTKPVYFYTDETGVKRFTLDEAILKDKNAKNIKKLTFDEINKEYGKNAQFQKYKEIYIDNKGKNNAAEKENYAKQMNELYNKYKEYEKHQRVVDYIEGKVNQTVKK